MRACACGKVWIDGGPHRYPPVINKLKNSPEGLYIKISGEQEDWKMVIVDTNLDENDLMKDWNYRKDQYGQFIEENPPKYVNNVRDMSSLA
jgi:hypothetical protein